MKGFSLSQNYIDDLPESLRKNLQQRFNLYMAKIKGRGMYPAMEIEEEPTAPDHRDDDTGLKLYDLNNFRKKD